MKTSELQGAALDWAVARCDGLKVNVGFRNLTYTPKGKRTLYNYTPSTNWAQGGPIIERERIELVPHGKAGSWSAMYADQHIGVEGPTPLIAAMRCYVASKLGNDVDISNELTTGESE